MINVDKTINSINAAIEAIEHYVQKYDFPNEAYSSTLKVLRLIKDELLHNANDINERLLRAFKDVCTSIARQDEETEFYNPIFEIYNEFDAKIPKFKSLELLRMDFGKGDPI